MPRVALHSTFRRRMQMLVMTFHAVGISLFLSLFFLCCAIPALWPLIFVYIVFIAVDPRPGQGTQLSPLQRLTRSASWWRQFAEYFPISLHKTVELKPCFEEPKQGEARWSVVSYSRIWYKMLLWWFYVLTFCRHKVDLRPTGQRYIFGYHPHGIIGMGALGGICTEGAGWSKLFPGIPVRVLTLRSNFYLPFYREYLLAMGMAMVSKESILNLLNNSNPVAIVLGGARESIMAQPGRMDLVLENRFGFVKIALQTGASLVPVIAFGENDIYKQEVDDGVAGQLHKFMTRFLGFTIPLFHARGIFNYDMGILPYRKQIDVVVGPAIDIPILENFTIDDVKKHHRRYVKALTKLYNDNKDKFGYSDIPLRIVA